MTAEQELAARIAELERALRLIREWCLGQGYSGTVNLEMRKWIDAGMTGPIPPDALFYEGKFG